MVRPHKCSWKKIADIDLEKRLSGGVPTLPKKLKKDYNCYECSGYNKKCLFYDSPKNY